MKFRAIAAASLLAACSTGDAANPRAPDMAVPDVALPDAGAPDASADASVDGQPLPLVAPPVDVVSTAGAIDAWPRIVPGVEARAITSYDRSGGNDDGFAGTYSELYEENGEHVIFDAVGPGVLRTLWFTSRIDGNGPLSLGLVRFYFDDEPAARFVVDADALYTGATAPFVAPLVADNQISSGGFASWAPLVYRRRLKITTAVGAGFYQAVYDSLPPDWDVESTRAGDAPTATVARFGATGFSTLPLTTIPSDHTIAGAGTIDVLRFEPTAAPSPETLKAARMRIWFDGAASPQVDVPLDRFFGSGLGEATVRAVPWTMAPGQYESRFPMPFWNGAHIAISGIDGNVSIHTAAPLEPRDEVGTFTAVWHEERPTTAGVDYRYADISGSGKLVGTVLTVEPTSPTSKQWWEGDMQTWVDDLATTSIHGTGHEDDHLGGWSNEFLERPFTTPMQGCPKTEILDKPAGGQTNANATMYRLFTGIPFLRGIRHVTEHGTQNVRDENYSSVAFLYSSPRVRLKKTDETSAAPSTNVHLAIDEDNEGVKLRRVYDGAIAKQRAHVLVDGVNVGDWYVAETSTANAERDYFVPKQLTAGKTSIDVTLVPVGTATFDVKRLSAWSVSH